MPYSDSDVRIAMKANGNRMADGIEICAGGPDDLPVIEKLYPDAFPDDNLLPLVKVLLQEAPETLSLVGTVGETMVSHVVFMICGIAGTSFKVALLGPLAVASAWQKKRSWQRHSSQRFETAGECRRQPCLC